MFCIIAYLALVKLMFSFFSFNYLTFNLAPIFGARADSTSFLIMKPHFSRLWYLSERIYYNKKKMYVLNFRSRSHSNPHSLGCFLSVFFPGFHYKSKKSWSTCFLNVFFYSTLLTSFFLVRSCVCVSPLLMLFVCNYFFADYLPIQKAKNLIISRILCCEKQNKN